MMIPPGQALRPNNAAEEAELQRDGRAAGIIATLMGLTGAHQGSRNLQAAIEQGSPTRAAASVGQVGLSALPLSGSLVRAMTSTLPRALATVGGAGTTTAVADGELIGSAQAQTRRAQPSEELRRLQTELRDQGYYKGEPDGLPGLKTDLAVEKRDAARRAAQESEAASTRSAADLAKSQADAELARTQSEVAKAKLAKDKTDQSNREAAEKRLREGNEGWGAAITRALQNYGSNIGYLAGAVTPRIGGYQITNKLFQRGADKAQTLATRADDMMAAPIAGRGQAATSERIGRVNQFWDEGQRGTTPVSPFQLQPGPRNGPPVYKPNLAAPPAGHLYQPTAGDRINPALATSLVGGVESGASYAFLLEPAQREYDAAQAAVTGKEAPTEAEIQRLEAAKNRLAMATAMAKIGAGMAIGAVGSGIKNNVSMTRARPNTAPAEAMRGQLAKTLSRAAPKRKPKS